MSVVPETFTPTTIENYELQERIRREGNYTVYMGRRVDSDQQVIVRVLSENAARDPTNVKRFEQEYFIGCSLIHPNIARVLHFCDTVATPFIVVENVEGITLSDKIDRDGRLSEVQVVELARQLCQALDKIHSGGVIHRDVVPDHIKVTPTGQIKITNLGIAKDLMGDMELTRTGSSLGTPYFMAPEQFRNAKNVTALVDIYSIGAILYYTATGVKPFDGCSPFAAWTRKSRGEYEAVRDLAPEISERVAEIIECAMNANPRNRIPSCQKFLLELKNFKQGKPSNIAAYQQDKSNVVVGEPPAFESEEVEPPPFESPPRQSPEVPPSWPPNPFSPKRTGGAGGADSMEIGRGLPEIVKMLAPLLLALAGGLILGRVLFSYIL